MPHRRGVSLAIAILSGATVLIDEIARSPQLVLVFGNTTQAVCATAARLIRRGVA
jgi:hypothetical protein